MKKCAAWLPAIAWMGFIFFMSAAPGDLSGAQSGRLLELLLAAHGFFFSEGHLPLDTLDLLETLIRKAAHMGEYAVLALFYAHALFQNGSKRPARTALLLCTLYAATDEFHQAFVPERGPAVTDVAIDAIGASLGLALRQAFLRLRPRHTQSINS